MSKLIFSLLLAASGALGLASSNTAEAYDRGRIFVDIGDVTFSYGRPYWRFNHAPLYVVYERGYPRYYRYDDGYYYGPPRYAPAYGYRDRYWRAGRYEPRRGWHRDRWDRDWDHDRGRDRRDRRRHRDWD